MFQDGDALVRRAISMAVHGVKASPRGIPVREVELPVMLSLSDPAAPFLMSPARRPRYRFGMAEALWTLAGSNDLEEIARYNPVMREYSDDGETLWGAYGPRLVEQMDHVIDTLKRDKDSRQAVLTTWRPHSFGSYVSKDIPCTVAWAFSIRNDKLNLTVFMRSNDVFRGLPYDLVNFTTTQRVVAACLSVGVGSYTHIVNNLHVYESDVQTALEIMNEPHRASPKLPPFGEFYGAPFEWVSSVCHQVLIGQTLFLGDGELNMGLTPYYATLARDSNNDISRDLLSVARAPKVG